MMISTKYDIGQKVYLTTDEDQKERLVTKIMFDGQALYQLVCGVTTTWHYELELSEEKDVVKAAK